MANYGRGWDDGYGGQSAEAIDAHQERQEIEAGRIQNAAAKRRRDVVACQSTSMMKPKVNLNGPIVACGSCGAQGRHCSGPDDDQGPEYDDWIGVSDGKPCCHACYDQQST